MFEHDALNAFIAGILVGAWIVTLRLIAKREEGDFVDGLLWGLAIAVVVIVLVGLLR